tara:strand:- start:191 stop:463 length:273 start_codon:yes stop_codon:yes gene_type:complete
MPIIVNKNEPKNLTPEELEQLKQIKFEFEGYIFQIGQIALELENLTDDKNKIKELIDKLRQKETNLAEGLFKKYGKGEIDLEKGTITPIK